MTSPLPFSLVSLWLFLFLAVPQQPDSALPKILQGHLNGDF